MQVRLDRKTIVKLYCYSRQATRSVHRALAGGDWLGFQEYYRDRKIEIEQIVIEVSRLVPPELLAEPRKSREEIGKGVREPGLFRILFGKWLARRKTSWTFPDAEVHFLMSVLRSLLSLLDSTAKPGAEELVSLRMDLSCCDSIIACRCHGMEEIERARYLEHFEQTDWLPSVKLTDILEEQPKEKRKPRKSA